MKLFECFRDLGYVDQSYSYFVKFIKSELKTGKVDSFFANKYDVNWGGTSQNHEEEIYVIKDNKFWIFSFQGTKASSKYFYLKDVESLEKELIFNEEHFSCIGKLHHFVSEEYKFDKIEIVVHFKNNNERSFYKLKQKVSGEYNKLNSLSDFYNNIKEKVDSINTNIDD
ncbi:MAG: hypothetical protein ACOCRX_12525 [Candidatus Woesearchaeota archaeon]